MFPALLIKGGAWKKKKIRTVPYLYLELNEVKLSEATGAGAVIQRHGLAWRDLQAVFIPNNKKKSET